jgi:MFS family permease
LIGMSVLRCVAAAALDLPLQLYLRSLDASPLIIGLASTLTWTGMLVGGPLWGLLADRFSKKALLGVLLPGSAVTLALFAAHPPIPGTVGIVLVRALIVSGFAPLSMALASGASTARQRGSNLSYVSSARALGWVVGAASSGLLLESMGFRWTFAVLALLPLLSVGLLPGIATSRRAPGTSGRWPLHYLADRWLATLYSAVALRQMGVAGTFALVFVYMAELGVQTSSMGLLSALSSAAQVLGMIAFGALSDRLGRRWVFLLGFGVSVAPALVFAFIPTTAGLAMGHLAVGISFSAMYIGSTAHIGDVIPSERHGVMLGLFDSARAIGGAFGPLVAGAILPSLGFTRMLLTMSAISCLGFLLVLLGTRHAAIPNRMAAPRSPATP